MSIVGKKWLIHSLEHLEFAGWWNNWDRNSSAHQIHEKIIRLIFYILSLDNDQNLQEYLFKKTTTHSFINIKVSAYNLITLFFIN